MSTSATFREGVPYNVRQRESKRNCCTIVQDRTHSSSLLWATPFVTLALQSALVSMVKHTQLMAILAAFIGCVAGSSFVYY